MKSTAYCVINCNKKEINSSTSGGAFIILAKYYISKLQGVVFGCVIEDGVVYHKKATTLEGLSSFSKSKYVFSDLRNTFFEAAVSLKEGKHVLFSGTPCQIASLCHYLDYHFVNSDKLLTVELICHGAPKKEYWEMYLNETFGRDRPAFVDFRYKDASWEEYKFLAKSKSKSIKQLHNNNPYFISFVTNYILKDSCYNCRFKGENRKGDVVLGDFWDVQKFYPELFNKKGVSLVIIRQKKDLLLSIFKNEAKVDEISKCLGTQFNFSYNYPVAKPLDYDAKIANLKQFGFKVTFSKRLKKRNAFKKNVINFFRKRKIYKANSKDVAIVTDYGYWNFGNRLQNYALRKTLESFGFRGINITNKAEEKYFFARHYFGFKTLFNNKKLFFKIRKIRRACKKTREKTVSFSYDKYGKKQIALFKNVILGSDQIWNPHYNKNNLHFNLGIFGLINKKVNIISYAASFGNTEIPPNLVNVFKEGFALINNIGVRESECIPLVEQMGYNAVFNLDPTLLLSKKEWLYAVSKYATVDITDNNYIFQYILSKKDNTYPEDEMDSCKIINIMDEDHSSFLSNHFDFVNYIANAKLIVTDSFHAFVFSLIFGKKIYLIPRDDMKSRFLSIFKILGLEYRVNEIIDLSLTDFKKIESLRERSINFLIGGLQQVE